MACDRAGHCYLMDEIADDFCEAISDISFGDFAIDRIPDTRNYRAAAMR